MKYIQNNKTIFASHILILSCLLLTLTHLAYSLDIFHNPQNSSNKLSTLKCMIPDCLECQQNMPYTCKTCQQGKTCCSPFCKNCTTSNPTVCQQCQNNFLFNLTSKTCVFQNSCQQPHCSDCKTPDKVCQACDMGSNLNPFTLTCIPCPSGCSICNVTLDCQSCLGHYFFKDSVCLQCDETCQNCQFSSIHCLTCPSGYIFNNFTCLECPEHCLECDSPTNCTYCEEGHYIDNKTRKCQLCGQYCKICNSVTDCLQCTLNYFLDEKTGLCETCDEVIPNCQQCIDFKQRSKVQNINSSKYSSTVQCFQCQMRYILVNDTSCKACIPSCLNCSTLTTCDTCEKSYVFNQITKQCVLCTIPSCLMCKTPKQCAVCNSGFFWNVVTHPDFPFCEKCRTGCSSCGINYCRACEGGYYLSNSVCMKCNAICLQCVNSPDNCTTCGVGYFMGGNSQKCVKCPDDCTKCTGIDSCTDCALGYRNINKTCIKCSDQHCGFCQKDENSTQKCLQCVQKFVAKNHVCQACVEGCSICFQTGECIQCSQGYYSDDDTQFCKACPNHCLVCQQSSAWHINCNRCEKGYFIDQRQDCQPCLIQNCQNCAFYGCVKCVSKFYFNRDQNTCNPCPKNCTQCIDDFACVQCIQGFYLKDLQCLQCQHGCQICVSQNSCVICSSGFRLDPHSNTCQACKTVNCASCLSEVGICSQCYPGFTLEKTASISENETTSNSLCFKCGQNSLQGCKSCLSSQLCFECIDGYIMNERNLCEVQTYKTWAYVLVICLLSGLLLVIAGFKIKRMREEGASLRDILKGDKNLKHSENYHKLQDLGLN